MGVVVGVGVRLIGAVPVELLGAAPARVGQAPVLGRGAPAAAMAGLAAPWHGQGGDVGMGALVHGVG